MGFTITNVDATLIAEAPKISAYRADIRESIARLLELPFERVGLKATTNEQLGSIGRREGIAALAVATVVRPSDDTR